MNNEANFPNLENNSQEEKEPLQDLDISNLIFIKNPNNEFALGLCEEKIQIDPLNTSSSIKHITHQHYGTIPHRNNLTIQTISRQDFMELKIHSLLIKYVVLLLSLVLITLDVKNIRNRISSQEEIISEVTYK
jgi:hypothetical protein